MKRIPAPAPPSHRPRRQTGWVWAGLVLVGLALLVGSLWFYAYLKWENPTLGRSLGLLPPLIVESEEPRLLEGYTYRNFEVQTFVPCQEYTGDLFAGDVYGLGSQDANFDRLLQQLADAQGKKITFGVSAYIRFNGQRTWLKNGLFMRDYYRYSKTAQILTLLELQPMQNQCQK